MEMVKIMTEEDDDGTVVIADDIDNDDVLKPLNVFN